MKLDFVSFRWPFLTLGLLAALAFAACTQPEPTDSETPPTEAPPIAASATMPAQEIPVSDFVGQYEAISKEWDLFHDDFDRWNAGLSSCHPNAMHLALNDFAVSFNSVTQQARDLSRGSTSGELADLLIASAEEEEAAFRHLRDRWQPNNVSLFENVEQQRTKSSQAQKSSEDRAIELREGFEDVVDPEATEAFLQAFLPIGDAWKQLHDDYEAARDDAEKEGATAVANLLAQHAEGLEAVIEGLEELPELDGSEETVEKLLDTAKAELEAFTGDAESTDGASETKSESADTTADASAESTEKTDAAETESTETADQADGATDTAADANESAEATDQADGAADSTASETESTEAADQTAETTAQAAAEATSKVDKAAAPDLEALDEIIAANAKTLKQSGRDLEDLADPDAEKGLAELATFDTEYRRLLRSWDSFHQDYNDWRIDDGGCDRTEVVAELDRYSIRVSQLARDARALPSAGYLLPIYTLLTEAAARDESAVRTLRYTWQPFTLDSFKAVHQERINTENLRREADIAVQELRSRS